MRTITMIVAAAAFSACTPRVDYTGTAYQCPDGVTCPAGFTCIDQVCEPSRIASDPDGGPGRADADPTQPDGGDVVHVDGGNGDAASGGAMVDIPAGAFLRGCTVLAGISCLNDTEPQMSITLSAFRIDVDEVTQGDYQACVAAGSCATPAAHFDPVGKANRPVTDVTYNDAVAYCASVGKRLPTEAEWEKAARGGDGRTFPWGEPKPDCARVSFDNCDSAPAVVGTHPDAISPYGVNDMAGNVAEWVADYYSSSYYLSAPATDPPGPTSGSKRVVRGGDWESVSDFLRTFDRDPWAPSTTKDFIGFRCAR